jgi:hypothetical protein
MKYTTEELKDIICENNDKQVVLESWELGKDTFSNNNLRDIIKYFNFKEVVLEAWKLCKKLLNI